MAGGMSKRGAWGPMSERVSAESVPEPPPIRHCWVTDSNGRLPGLLLEWRQVEGVWRGRVVHPVLEDDAWVVVEEWLPAGLLDPG
jgi:hypothetical protein